GIGSVAGAFFGGMILGAFPIMSSMFSSNALGIFGLWSIATRDVLAFSPGPMGIRLARDPDGAAPQPAAAFKPVSQSPPALGVAAVGGVGLWALARGDVIGNWSFLVAALVLVFVVLPLLALVFAPPEVPGRRAPTVAWMAVALVVAAVVPWGTA